MGKDADLVRMQILLHSEEREALEYEARRLGVSMSEVIRQSLRALREEQAEYDAVDRENDPFFKLIGAARLGDSDASQKIDEELYGRRSDTAD